jgi:hypothetical protein
MVDLPILPEGIRPQSDSLKGEGSVYRTPKKAHGLDTQSYEAFYLGLPYCYLPAFHTDLLRRFQMEKNIDIQTWLFQAPRLLVTGLPAGTEPSWGRNLVLIPKDYAKKFIEFVTGIQILDRIAKTYLWLGLSTVTIAHPGWTQTEVSHKGMPPWVDLHVIGFADHQGACVLQAPVPGQAGWPLAPCSTIYWPKKDPLILKAARAILQEDPVSYVDAVMGPVITAPTHPVTKEQFMGIVQVTEEDPV